MKIFFIALGAFIIAAGINTGMNLKSGRNLDSEIMSAGICILLGLYLMSKGIKRNQV
ncbi:MULTISPECIES: hypothetical protein [Hymenobacter]|uniref:hypothetical protein n=1 Tax=Hymenobacter TaxID=89966 RepID=UPI001AAD39BC|nr:hypothetical protein [Hymenobacter sp. BT559]